MTYRHPFVVALGVLGTFALLTPRPAAQVEGAPIVVRNVTVIDGSGRAPQPGMTVVVTGNTIAEVGRTPRVPPQAVVIDGTGKFLIPGLWDMHLHLRGDARVPRYNTFGEVLLVAHGVTGARVMAGLPRFHRIKQSNEAGQTIGPRLEISSRNMDGLIPKQPLPPTWGDTAAEAEEWQSVGIGQIPRAYQITNAEQARAAVAEAKASGVEFLKIHNELTPDAYFAIAAEAKAHGLYLVGHVPTGLTLAQLSDTGMRSIEHWGGTLEGCSSREAEIVKGQLAALALPASERTRRTAELRRMAVDSFDAAKCAALAARLRRNNTWLSPTFMPEGGVRAAAGRNTDLAQYVFAPLRAAWQQQLANAPAPAPPSAEARDLANRIEERNHEIVAIMKKGGVQFVIGTDSGGPWRIPGRSLHEGLIETNRAGLTPMELIVAATSSSARLLRRDARVGTVEAGKLADLVLLDANPLQDIRNTQRINAVFVNGRLLDRATIDATLAQLAAAQAGSVSAQPSATAVRPATVSGPVPVAADSYPLMAADKVQVVVDLKKYGYVEEEFFISGSANVYDWQADGGLTVRTPNAPYTTRILVRRPADPRNFSGTAVVELPNMARRYDWVMTWSLQHEYFLEHGDIWISLTFAPVGLDGLKAFNPARYASLSMANPTPDVVCPAAGPTGGAAAAAPPPPGRASPAEEGLRWDMLSQLGALLKAPHTTGFLAGFDVRRLFATTHTGELATYISAVHPHATLNGRPIYDGYVIYRHVGLSRIHNCAPTMAAADPRQILRNVNVPVIRIIPGETDVIATYQRRREDSDAPGDRYRLYEIAGAPHADEAAYRYIPSREDQAKVGTPAYLSFWPFLNQCAIEQAMLVLPVTTYAGAAIFENLERWVRDGVAPPRAERISLLNPGTPQAAVERDPFGNVVGGVRSPYLDVPTGTYYTSRPGGQLGPGVRCDEIGYKVPFDWARLEAIYGTSDRYRARLGESVDRLVQARYLRAVDGKKVLSETVVPVTAVR